MTELGVYKQYLVAYHPYCFPLDHPSKLGVHILGSEAHFLFFSGIEACRHCMLMAAKVATSFWPQQTEKTESYVNPLTDAKAFAVAIGKGAAAYRL